MITGGCLCGAVRFRVTAPFESAGWCHCTRCQRRTGAIGSVNGSAAPEAFEITQGAEHVREWAPPDGAAKAFCGECGAHLFSRGARIGVRLGAIDGDPGIRPQYHQFTAYAAPWHPLPDDGLPRYPERRPPGA